MTKVHWVIDGRLTRSVNVLSSRCDQDALIPVRRATAHRTASELGRTALPVRTEVQLAVTEAVVDWEHSRLAKQLVNRLDGSSVAATAVDDVVTVANDVTVAIFWATFNPPVGAIVVAIDRAVRNEIEPNP